MMTVEKAKEVAQFLKANEISYVNVMGGEFFCNPEWPEIMRILIKEVRMMRLVTNSDWFPSDKQKNLLEEFIKESDHLGKLKVCLSKDEWHTNTWVEQAYEFLKSLGLERVQIETPDEGRDYGVVPVGRGELVGSFGFYSFLGCYCQNPENKYTFLIDEEGKIYKCGFGVMDYAETKDYLEGGFAQRFKEFNMKFYSLPVLHCKMCVRVLEGQEKRSVKRE